MKCLSSALTTYRVSLDSFFLAKFGEFMSL